MHLHAPIWFTALFNITAGFTTLFRVNIDTYQGLSTLQLPVTPHTPELLISQVLFTPESAVTTFS